jgi:hypothetical protein
LSSFRPGSGPISDKWRCSTSIKEA